MALNPKMRRKQREDSKLDAMLKGVATGSGVFFFKFLNYKEENKF